MKTIYTKTKVLITVITYPHPSRSYTELVCTAGIKENYEWVRLYPIDYRYRPNNQRFRKYQWIDVELASRGSGNDNRKESQEPRLESINLLGEPLSTKNNWEERQKIIDKLPVYTLNELKKLYNKEKTSLGIVKPEKVIDLKIHKDEREWKPEWQSSLRQLRLFETTKPLKKIPFKFSYIFECKDSNKSHSAMILDWELGMLFLNELDRLNNERDAAKSVRNKFLYEICSPKKDTLFFMGTIFPYNTWVVLGVFWPPKAHRQLGLF